MKNKVAVIEDDRDINELIAYNLQKEGYNVIRSLDGGQGLFLIQKERPDLVLLDLMLPGMDGLEICQALKQGDATKDIPVIMITAYGDADTERKALAGGADALLTKPIDFDALRNRIDNRLPSAA